MHPRILVIFKTHLDIGFTDFAKNVMARYTSDFIPGALKLAKETRHSPERFVWTTGSWLAYRFLEDAPAAQRKVMEEAIEAGDFHWHALPFTTHSELMTPALFEAGLRFSQLLDARFGRKTIAAKMTDVPGHTRGIVPLLAAAGVKLLHIGVNPASSVPAVPPIFRWKAGGSEIVVVYEKEYGATTPLPGGLTLSVNLTNDNLGPQGTDEIHQTYERLRAQFPGAAITPGSLDQAAEHLWARRRALPVVTEEIGDTWIHGIGTDPLKVARFRELTRLREEWLSAGKLGTEADLRLAERLLLVAEHTWGLDIKTHLHDWRAYTARQLQRSLAKPNFKKAARSWAEQRSYLTDAVAGLPPALRDEAQARLKALRPRVSKGTSQITTRPGEPIRLGDFELQLDEHGAIQRLRRENRAEPLADARHRLAVCSYQTFSERDYRRFYRQYNTMDMDWARKDFTKPGLPADAPSQRLEPRLVSLIQLKNRPALVAALEFEPALQRQGAPAGLSLEITAVDDGLDLRLQWTSKTPTRLPEAIWLGFNPAPQKGKGEGWRLNKMGLDLNPLDVVSKGNRNLHGVTGSVGTGRFSVTSPDAVLVCPGTPHLLNFDDKAPELRHGIAYNLFNNLWGTNFPMWSADPAAFRFSLRWLA